jgi:hypothetical protein
MATIYVKKDGSGDATTIQQGIQLSAIGDVVEIEAGIFDENVDLWKGVTLKGAGINATTILGSFAQATAITPSQFNWTSGSTVIDLASGTTENYIVGRNVTATGIPSNTRIQAKTSTTLTLTAATTNNSTARNVNQGNCDATVRVRGTAGVIRDLKIVGWDHPTNPAVEYAGLHFRTAALGSGAANNWEVFNCEIVADGEYAILCNQGASIGNLNIHDCLISGKTFVGENPAIGNQFTVWNVPRQLVAIQDNNTGINYFVNNTITGATGGLTIDNIPSYNSAITFDAPGSIITGNVISGNFGAEGTTHYALRARGYNSIVSNNTNVIEPFPNNGYYILPSFNVVGISVTVGTMLFFSSRYWVCTQDHVTASTTSPTGVDGALYWSEITLQDVNDSGIFGVGVFTLGSNSSITDVPKLIIFNQTASGEPIEISIDKNMIKSITSVSSDPFFSEESNWNIVGIVYKKDSKRLTSGFRSDFTATNLMKLKQGLPSEQFLLHKIILSDSSRTLKVLNRSDISDASSLDITLL